MSSSMTDRASPPLSLAAFRGKHCHHWFWPPLGPCLSFYIQTPTMLWRDFLRAMKRTRVLTTAATAVLATNPPTLVNVNQPGSAKPALSRFVRTNAGLELTGECAGELEDQGR